MNRLPAQRRKEIKAEVLAWIRTGRPMTELLSREGYPEPYTIQSWRRADEAFDAAYLEAREIGYDAIAEQMRVTASAPLEGVGFQQNIEINHRRLMLDTDKWLLARWSGRYAERQRVDHQGGVSLRVVTGVPPREQLTSEAPKPVHGRVVASLNGHVPRLTDDDQDYEVPF